MEKKEQVVTEEHHRRQESLGGSSSLANISYVSPELHRAWHCLSGNMNAFQICNFLNHLENFVPPGKKLVCKFINGTMVTGSGGNHSKKRNRILKAMKTLFGNISSFEERIAFINNVWLDPSYHLYIECDDEKTKSVS